MVCWYFIPSCPLCGYTRLEWVYGRQRWEHILNEYFHTEFSVYVADVEERFTLLRVGGVSENVFPPKTIILFAHATAW